MVYHNNIIERIHLNKCKYALRVAAALYKDDETRNKDVLLALS